MKKYYNKIKDIINIFIPLLLTLVIFYSGNIDQRVSEINTNYIIDVATLNNSFAYINLSASNHDNDLYQKYFNEYKDQIKQLNAKYGKEFDEQKNLETKKKWVDPFVYILIFILFVFNSIKIKNTDSPNLVKTKNKI